jgi:hypothetical protein
MNPENAQPSIVVRVIGWITTPIIYVVLVRIVISGIRHLPAHRR